MPARSPISFCADRLVVGDSSLRPENGCSQVRRRRLTIDSATKRLAPSSATKRRCRSERRAARALGFAVFTNITILSKVRSPLRQLW